MRILVSTISLYCLLATVSFPATAGPNANGALILHSDPTLVYCTDDSPCDLVSGSPLVVCQDAITRIDDSGTHVFWVYASFFPESSPRMAGVTFGIEYIDGIVLSAWSPCGDFELATSSWPASSEGTAVTWSTAQMESLIPVYGFAGYDYYGEVGTFDLVPHPTQGGFFADDDVPSNLDEISAFGALGFFTDGTLPCGSGTVGACCFSDCSCEMLYREDCEAGGGNFLGDGTTCDPNPCECDEGACCFEDGSCLVLTADECASQGGVDFFPQESCDPNPCEVVPVIESSWGEVKRFYRR